MNKLKAYFKDAHNWVQIVCLFIIWYFLPNWHFGDWQFWMMVIVLSVYSSSNYAQGKRGSLKGEE